MTDHLVIPRRFNGPPDSANGGYACGLVAQLLGGEAEVTLRTPPPLERPLEVVRAGERVELRDGDTLVAEGVRNDLEWAELAGPGPDMSGPYDVPPPVSVEEAEAARKAFPGFKHHAYSTCFVCGPDRSDGLGIFPGPLPGRDVVAAPWLPAAGDVPPELVWAALDCPSGWAVDQFYREGVLLGRLAARLLQPVAGGEPHVVAGWALGEDGRKRFAGSAVFTADGELCAHALSTWIVPRTS